MLTCESYEKVDVKTGSFVPLVHTFVSPRGEFIAHRASDYGLIGNRGVLHDDQGVIVMRSASKAWIACTPSRNASDPKRPATEPGRYTLLRFLDEATALAAGHRPCWTCRRSEFYQFLAAWTTGNLGHGLGADLRIAKVDAVIHRQRIDVDGQKVTFTAPLDVLPNGCVVQITGADYLVFGSHLFRWSPAGYTERIARSPGVSVRVLTPRSIVSALGARYEPQVHPSVRL